MNMFPKKRKDNNTAEININQEVKTELICLTRRENKTHCITIEDCKISVLESI